MKKLIKKLEDLMVAVTFAEAGEYREAAKLSKDGLPADPDETGGLGNFKKPHPETAK